MCVLRTAADARQVNEQLALEKKVAILSKSFMGLEVAAYCVNCLLAIITLNMKEAACNVKHVVKIDMYHVLLILIVNRCAKSDM